MSVLDVANEVAAAVGVTQLTSLFSTSVQPRTQLEMRSLLNEMAKRIAYDTREWTILKLFHTITGNGVAESFDLPIDYQRMLVTTQLYQTENPTQPLQFIADTDEWLQRRMIGAVYGYSEWTIIGNQIFIYPILTGQVKFAYLSKNCIKTTNILDEFVDKFTNDADTFRLPERLLKLGAIWQWKANKGSPYAEDMGTYSDALATTMGADKPAPILIGRLPANKLLPVVVAEVTTT